MDKSSDLALPGAHYSSQDHYGRELNSIHRRSWWIVGHTSEWERAGDFKRYELFSENIIVVRNRRGELHAMVNICQHRGAEICTTPQGNAGAVLRCPYHGWTYRHDGSVLGVPSREAFDADTTGRRLPRVSVDVALGFVWVNLDPECDSLQVHLDLLFKMRFGDAPNPFRENGIEKLSLARTIDYGTIGANWKLLWENFSECYHCPTLHDSLCDAVPQFAAGYGTVTGPQGQGARLADSYEGFSSTGSRVGSVLPGLSSSDERMFYGALLWPTGQIVCVSDHATLLCMIPEGPDRTRVIGYWLFQQSDIDDPSFDPGPAVDLFDKTNREDFDACARMQKNTTSSHWNSSHLYAPFEYRISSFRQWVEVAMSASSITEAYLSAAAQPAGWDAIHHYIGSGSAPEPAGIGEKL